MASDFNERQLTRMKEKILQYKEGTETPGMLIGNLYALYEILDPRPGKPWSDAYEAVFGEMDDLYGVAASSERKAMTPDEVEEFNSLVGRLEKVLKSEFSS